MISNMANDAERWSLNDVHDGVLDITHIPCFESLAIHKSFHILPTDFEMHVRCWGQVDAVVGSCVIEYLYLLVES